MLRPLIRSQNRLRPILGQALGANIEPYPVPGEWLVRFKGVSGTPEEQIQGVEELVQGSGLGVTVADYLGLDGLVLLQAPPNLSGQQLSASLESLRGFQYAEPNMMSLSIGARYPNDPMFTELWGLHNTGQYGGTPDADIDAPEAWTVSTGDGSVVVAVIDTGLDFNHPDLVNRVWTNPREIPGNGIDDDQDGYVDDVHGWDFVNYDNDPMDDNGHGTHVSGTIAAEGNNGVGVVGVNWDAQIMPLKFLDAGGWGSTDNAVRAINYATWMRAHGVNVPLTSNSWGGYGYSQALKDAIQASGQAGMLCIAAAGNENNNNDSNPSYPASYDLDNIISVAATDLNDLKAGFSNYGAVSVDLGAPGVGITSTTPGNSYSTWSGTSMATPHVSGVAALAWSLAPDAAPQQIRNAILAGVDPVPSLAGITVTGGRLNAFNTLRGVSMFVVGSSPAAGQTSNTPPTNFVIDFSRAYDPAAVDASDLTVNGIPANSWLPTDAGTVTFRYTNSPVTNQGLQTMHMSAGVLRADPNLGLAAPLVREFSADFYYDAISMAVSSAVPASGSGLKLPFTSLQVDFNEPYDPASVDTDDLLLSQGSAYKVEVIDADSVRFLLEGIENEGTLTARIPAGSVLDQYGFANVEFVGTYELDFDTFAYPVPLVPVEPLGSLIYDPIREGRVAPAADTDSFSVSVDPGQTITVLVKSSSSLQATVSITQAGSTLASVTAQHPGSDVVLQTIRTPGSLAGEEPGPRTYMITVGGANETTGNYTIEIILNAAIELEAHGGPFNDTVATAEDLEGSFIALHNNDGSGPRPERGAVLGSLQYNILSTVYFEDFENGAQGFTVNNTSPYSQYLPGLWHLSAGRGAQEGHSANTSFYYGQGEGPDGGGTYHVGYTWRPTTGTITSPSITLPTGGTCLLDFNYVLQTRVWPDGVDFADLQIDAGSGWTSLRRFDRVAESTSWRTSDPVDLSAYAGQTIQLRWSFDTVRGPVGRYPEGWYIDDVRIRQVTTLELKDYYKLTLAAGQSATIALNSLNAGNVDLELIDLDGTTLAVGSTDAATNSDEIISNFVATAPGEYCLKVTGDFGTNYSLVVTRNADFDAEPNSHLATAKDLIATEAAGRRWMLGYLGDDPYEASAVPFTFEDISSTDTSVLSGVDDDATHLSAADLAGFQFDFFDTTYTDLFIGSNGLITFGSGDDATAYDNTDLTSFPSAATIAAFWDDLEDFSTNGAVYWQVLGTGASQRLIIQWDDFRFYGSSGNTITFQAVLNEADNSIQFNYLNLTAGGLEDEGAWATVGVKDAGSQGPGRLLLCFNSGPNTWVGTGKSTRIARPQADVYSFTAAAGQVIDLFTSTPAHAFGEFVNTLDPLVRLYDAAGDVVASNDNGDPDGRNARLTYNVPSGAGGTYYVEVTSSDLTPGPTTGEYILSVKGATGALPPFQVAAVNPADGARVRGPVSEVTIDFNDIFLLDTLEASDVKFDGVEASAVRVLDADTAVFTVSGPLSEGLHTVTIEAGALKDVQGTPIGAFSSRFYNDIAAPTVVSSSIQEGDVLRNTPGSFQYVAQFSEELDTTNLDPSDFGLLDLYHGVAYSADSFGYEAATSTLTVRYSGLPEGHYQLTLFNGDGRFEDLLGWNLDGEPRAWPIPPNRSGDGSEGGDFYISFLVDVVTAAYPTPLVAEPPLGSLIYDPSYTDVMIQFVGDTDSFTLDVDPGQTITVVVDPAAELQPTVELRDPSNMLIGSAAAGAPGQSALLETAAATAAGTYTVTVGGAAGTMGLYTVRLTLNAALEQEAHGGPTNNTIPSAQDLSASFLPLLKGADRAAALGTIDQTMTTVFYAGFESGNDAFTVDNYAGGLWHRSTGRGYEAGHSSPYSFYYGKNEGPTGGGTYDTGSRNAGSLTSPWIALPVGARITLDFNYMLRTEYYNYYDRAEVQVNSGAGFVTVASYNAVAESSVWRAATQVNLSAYAGKTIQLRWSFDTVDWLYNWYEGWYVDDVLIRATLAPDYYAFSLAAGENATLALTAPEGGNVDLRLENASGTTLATGTPVSTNVGEVIANYVAPVAGTYYARISGEGGVDYSVVITRDAVFDTESNNGFESAQDFAGLDVALGHVSAGRPGVNGRDLGILLADQTSAAPVSQLRATGRFDTITVYDVLSSTPTLAMLQAYDTILVYTDYAPYDRVALGNVLADYVDAGGHVVLATYAFSTPWNIAGRIMTPGYSPLENLGIKGDVTGNLVATVPSDPMFDGINLGAVAYWHNWNFAYAGLDTGATLLASDGAGHNMIAENAAGNVVGLNFYLSTWVPNNQELFKLVGNALVVGRPADEDWYRFSVTAGEGVHLNTSTPADGLGEFANNLDPHIELYDPSGNLVASGAPLADGRNEQINHIALVAGAYRIRVVAENGTKGEYMFMREVNVAPLLDPVGNKTVDEEQALTFTATATDPDLPANTLSFSLVGAPEQALTFTATATDHDLPANTLTFSLEGAPAGASIDASSGVFTWTPTEAQGPGTYEFTVKVTDNGSPVMSDEEEITVTVNEVNVAPVLGAIGNKEVNEGSALTFTATATDHDLPANGLTFSLVGGPEGASIDANTGAFNWTPADNGVFEFKFKVTDDGTPSLSDEEEIAVTVKNVAPYALSLTPNPATLYINGKTYLSGAFSDPGTLDTHEVVIDWGENSATTTLNLTAGVLGFNNVEHQYVTPDSHAVTVTVKDTGPGDSGTTSATTTVTVLYNLGSGFLEPVSLNRQFKLGSTIPLKWQLTDANGNFITTLSAIRTLKVVWGLDTEKPGTVSTLYDGTRETPVNNFNSGGTVLRNDGSQYIFNWQTKTPFTVGSYAIELTLNDGTVKNQQIVKLSTSGGALKLVADTAGSSSNSAGAGALLAGDLTLYVDNSSRTLATADLNLADTGVGPSALRAVPIQAIAAFAAMTPAPSGLGTEAEDSLSALSAFAPGTFGPTSETFGPIGSSRGSLDSQGARVRDQLFQLLATEKNQADGLDGWLSSVRVGKGEAETIGSLSSLLTNTLSHKELADEAEAGFLDEELLEILALTS